MAFQQTLSSHSVFLIPWDTPVNNPSRAKQEYLISCILRVLFLVFVLTCRTRRRKAISQLLASIFRSGTDCLEPLPDCLHGIALEYSSSTVW
ncbi:hypothetical protein ACFXTI_024676 [Malus domestica]